MRKLLFVTALVLCLIPLDSMAGIGWVSVPNNVNNFGFCSDGKDTKFFFGSYYIDSADVPAQLFQEITDAIVHGPKGARIPTSVREEGQEKQTVCGMNGTFNEVTGVNF